MGGNQNSMQTCCWGTRRKISLKDLGVVGKVILNCIKKEKNFGLNLCASDWGLMYMKHTILLQAWTGPESSRRLRFPGFKTIST